MDALKFDELVQFRVPPHLSEAIVAAAKQRCQSKSEYIRQSVVDRLRMDGVDLHYIAGRAICAFFALTVIASSAMAAGTIPLSMTQQLDSLGKPLSGGRLFLIQAGTTSTPQNCYKDSGLTLPWPNPVTLDSAGRIPQLFCADGSIKIRLTDKYGVSQLVVDGILVVGPSGGGGGGSSVDPTTIFQTGSFMQFYGTGIISGWVRCNGRTIGSVSSGASERANADTSALYSYLWSADSALAVSGGRGASAAADFAANKTIALPDCRGRVLAGFDDMGSTAAGRLTTATMSGTGIGSVGGSQTHTLTPAEIPSLTSTGSATPSSSRNLVTTPTSTLSSSLPVNPGAANYVPYTSDIAGWLNASSIPVSVTTTGTSGSAHAIVQPTILATTYLKL